MKYLKYVLAIATALLVALSIAEASRRRSSSGTRTNSKAFKSSFFEVVGEDRLDHTYFCLNGTRDCHSITGWGITSGKSGGSYVSGSSGWQNSEQRCRARYYASNSYWNPCYIFYGITGVCHTQTDRGLYESGRSMNPNSVMGRWLSIIGYGKYGGAGSGVIGSAASLAWWRSWWWCKRRGRSNCD